MDTPKTVPPHRRDRSGGDAQAFTCPFCHVFARQSWEALYEKDYLATYTARRENPQAPDEYRVVRLELTYSKCTHCDKWMLWVDDRVLVPATTNAPMPSVDLPEQVRGTYDEASAILDLSPRAAAALMRLALQELMVALGENGDLNTSIGNLVRERGLRPDIQRALDVVRVIGNNAIHPGQIDLRDDRERAAAMFPLVNAIVHDLITRPREIDALYHELPGTIREQIEKRDS